MRHSIIALAAAAGLAFTAVSTASAADVQRPTSFAAPSYAAPFTWTGPYVGIFFGHASGTVDQSPVQTGPYGEELGAISPEGWLGGLQLGYNYQWGRFVLGAVTDFTLFGSVNGSRDINWCPGSIGYSCSETQGTKIDWLGTVRGRFGFTPFDRFLVFGTAGVAYGKTTTTRDYAFNGFGWNYSSTSKSSNFGVGPAYGAGIEWAFANNWTLGAEWLHVDLGVMKSSYADSFGGSFSSSTSVRADIIRAALNYKF